MIVQLTEYGEENNGCDAAGLIAVEKQIDGGTTLRRM